MSWSPAPYVPLSNAVAALLAPHAEVVIHDLRSDRIAHIAGNFSRRRVGDPSLNDRANVGSFEHDVIGPYAKSNWDGRALRSISIVLRNAERVPEGLLCINVDVSAFEVARAALAGLLTLPDPGLPRGKALFPLDWREAINDEVATFLAERRATIAGLGVADQIALLVRLDDRALFEVRGAANHVADVLGCSRATFYKRLASARAARKDDAA